LFQTEAADPGINARCDFCPTRQAAACGELKFKKNRKNLKEDRKKEEGDCVEKI
jgi:hypothetical protein